MKKSVLAIIALVIFVIAGLASYFTLTSFNIFVPTYLVHLSEKPDPSYDVMAQNGTYYRPYKALLLVFTQNNKTITKCDLGENGMFALDRARTLTVSYGSARMIKPKF